MTGRTQKTGNSLFELAILFLKLGATAFGGPAVHIAMMEDEVVTRRKWLSHAQFMDLLGAANMIPGPNSTEMAIHIGYIRAGVAGLLIAGLSFILPAVLIVGGLAWCYVQYGNLPEIRRLLYGVKPVMIAVILQALWRLGGSALKTRFLAVFAFICFLAYFFGANELTVLFSAALFAFLAVRFSAKQLSAVSGFLIGSGAIYQTVQAAAAALKIPFSLEKLFFFFLKIGSVLFGSGYVLLAFLRGDLVERWHWLTESQLLDAIAIGQVTPGPVFTTATFVGYMLGGFSGALLATAGIFIPAFFFVAVSGPVIPKLRRSKTASAVLDGVNAASFSLMAVTVWRLGRGILLDGISMAVFLAAFLLIARFKLNAAWLMLAGALIGFFMIQS